MAYPFSLVENLKIVDGTTGPVTTNGGVTCDSVSLKNAHKAWIVCKFHQAASHETVVTPKVGAAVASATTSITFSAKWWKNANVATNDLMAAQTAATTATCTAGTTHQIIVIEIDPADVVAQGVTYDCLGCTVSNSSQGTNFVDVTYYLAWRYPQDQPADAIAD